MNRVFVVGATLTAAGVAGYALGVATPYRGRAFSVTLVMVGIALVAMRRAFDTAEVDR